MTPRRLPMAGDERGCIVGFIAEEALEALERRLRAAGFPPQGTVVDQEWGRSLFVRAPDGTVVQIDEQDPELYTLAPRTTDG
jgi:hypothetical protein